MQVCSGNVAHSAKKYSPTEKERSSYTHRSFYAKKIFFALSCGAIRWGVGPRQECDQLAWNLIVGCSSEVFGRQWLLRVCQLQQLTKRCRPRLLTFCIKYSQSFHCTNNVLTCTIFFTDAKSCEAICIAGTAVAEVFLQQYGTYQSKLAQRRDANNSASTIQDSSHVKNHFKSPQGTLF